MRIRLATVDDAEALGLLHVRTWRATYAGQMPQSYLDGLDPVQRAARWVEIVTTARPPTASTVAEDGDIVGFVSIGPGTDDDAGPGRGEVRAIYVAPDRWGHGVGRLLMDEAVRQLWAAGFGSATLWVLDTNARARRFYERSGWHPDGATQTDDSRGFPLHEVRYHLVAAISHG